MIGDSYKKFRESQDLDSDCEDCLPEDMFKSNLLKKPNTNSNFNKLLDECSELNQNLLRTSQILGCFDINQSESKK